MPDEQSAAEPESDTADGDDTAVGDDTADGEHTGGVHAAPEGAPLHPLIDLSRDPTPGEPDHASPQDD